MCSWMDHRNLILKSEIPNLHPVQAFVHYGGKDKEWIRNIIGLLGFHRLLPVWPYKTYSKLNIKWRGGQKVFKIN